MSLDRILAISGKPGLYELKVQTRTGFVAESLVDGKRSTIGLKHNVSLLSEISMYTYDDEVKLFVVFKAIAQKENFKAAVSHKEDNAVLTNYFREILPEFDEERVYVSDIKKVLNWYNILENRGMITEEAFSDKAAVETPVAESVEK
ncbi:DUF5606 domain-containing protein [Flavobacterium sp. JP2137]|uniref:DUF5606 family protein n=1 Tax=Flavobacterium sp. JP2137 TaxID=3414510 RepID=UPI003D3009D6